MRIKLVFYLALTLNMLLMGCSATNIAYTPATNVNNKEAAALIKELSISQVSKKIKPENIEILTTLMLWENDAIVFNSVTSIELLQKADKYLVQINFKGDVFRKSDWFVVYSTDKLEDAKRYIDALSSLIFPEKPQAESIKTP
jgi:hypothetical protein